MKVIRVLVILTILIAGGIVMLYAQNTKDNMENKMQKTDEEWHCLLSDEQYNVMRKKGTERAFTGKYWNNHKKGVYYCAACNSPLFSSETKFESGSGWPSYFQPINDSCVVEHEDNSYGMKRVEVLCAKCGGHLGHVFNDGPKPTGLRYCINSAALKFVKDEKEEK